jgi:hypothetical protein
MASPALPSITALCPYLHVADVDASLTFYALLGLHSSDAMRGPDGRAFWASASCDGARVMFARASGKVDASVQAALLYLYSPDVRALRVRLLAAGLNDGGTFAGETGVIHLSTVYQVSTPFYMPAGELRLSDPDGYCLLIGQTA